MSKPLGNWTFILAVWAGLLPSPARPETVLPTGAVAQVEKPATNVYHGLGIVTEIDAATGALTLDHEDIVGLMPAMVMMYRVETPEMSRKLKVGDRIAFDLDGKSFTILGVKVISP